MSSKFFGDSDTESSGDEAVAVAAPVAPSKTSKTGSARHRRVEEEKDEDTKKRVVVNQKDRTASTLQSAIASIHAHIASNDWASIFTEFTSITKLYEKSKYTTTPDYYVQFLVELEDKVNEILEDKEAKKSLSTAKAKGLTSVKSALKKYVKAFAADMTAYREAHAGEEEETEEEVEYEEVEVEVEEGEEGEEVEYEEVYEEVYEEEEEAEEAEEEVEYEEVEEEEEGEEEEEYEEEDEEEEEEVEEEAEEKPAAVATASGRVPRGRAFWLKSNSPDSDSDEDDFDFDEDDEDDKKPKKKNIKDKKAEKKEEKKAALAKKSDEAAATRQRKADAAAAAASAGAGGKEDEFTYENINKKLVELILKRGKKNFDRRDQTEKLNLYANNAKSPQQEIIIIFHLISVLFDVPTSASFLTLSQWRIVSKNVQRIFSILRRNKHIVLTDKTEIQEDQDESSETATVGGRSQLLLSIERLEEELSKSFQNIEQHAREYLERLRDEIVLTEIYSAAFEYYSRIEFEKKALILCGFTIRRIEHSYYKVNPSGLDQLARLCNYIYTTSNDSRLKTRAVLCQIYALAIHDQYYAARDVLLKTHLQENVNQMEPAAQIQLNRVLAQLGLCAFRKGLVWEAHTCLADFYSGNVKAKELLAQGVPRWQPGVSQELLERVEKRLLPYHMHISLDMLECAHLTSAMLLEVPNMAASNSNSEAKTRIISRPFRKNLDHLERSVFCGPPETTRDYIMVAAKALASGDWKKCADLINNLGVWRLIPNSEQVKALLAKKIQEEGLFTYLLRFGSVFDSISIDTLADTFELPASKVFTIVARMIGNENLSASFDGPTNCLIMHKSEASRLQSLALSLTEKAQYLVELNDRILEHKSGGSVSHQRNDNTSQAATDNRPTNAGNRNRGHQQQNQKRHHHGQNRQPNKNQGNKNRGHQNRK